MKKRAKIAIGFVFAAVVILSLSIYYLNSIAPTANATTEKNIETLVFNYINSERENASLAILNNDTQLTISAKLHSQNMSTLGYVSTTEPGQVTYQTRISAVGYNFTNAGEDVAQWNSNGLWTIPVLGPMLIDANSVAKNCVDWWMYSSCTCNRENILGNFSDVGVGVSVNGSTIYITADFGSK
jgi:uncharacterized protein YkwD